jgi:hypothetical protein
MTMNSLAVLVVALVVAAIAIFIQRQQAKAPTDEQLREWLSFITKANGRPSSARLNAHEYDAIRLLFHPALKAEYEEKQTRLDNEFSARAIESTLVFRRQAEGQPLSTADQEILRREGLIKDSLPKSSGEPLEFTPGKFRKEKETDDPIEETKID